MVYGHQGGYGQHRRRGAGSRWLARRGVRRPLFGLGITAAGMAAAALAVVVGIGSASGTPACASVLRAGGLSAQAGGTATGIATHYVLQGLPNCSYPSPPADQLFVALSPAEYASAGGCGGYLEVSGPDGSVRVKVIDQCPECATGHIDLSETAFAKLSPLGAGLINVHYTYLADPALPGPISMEVKDGSSQYWLALLADNTGNPLTSVAVQTASGWQSLQRADYNYWIAQSGAGSGPFTVRLTDSQGNVATVSGITLSPGTTQVTGNYMYGAGSAPPPPPAPASTAPASAPPASAPASTAASTPAPASSGASASATVGPSGSASPSASPSRSPSARQQKAGAKKQAQAQAAAISLPSLTAAVPVPATSPTC